MSRNFNLALHVADTQIQLPAATSAPSLGNVMVVTNVTPSGDVSLGFAPATSGGGGSGAALPPATAADQVLVSTAAGANWSPTTTLFLGNY